MAHQGGSGGNMARPSNPSGQFTPSSPTPATIGAQASQALFQFQENQFDDASIGARAPQLGHPTAADTLVPPAMAPQTFDFQFQPHNAINTLPYQPFQPNNNYAHGWYQAQPLPPQQQQAPPAPRYAALQHPIEPGYSGNNPALPPPPLDAHILQRPMVAIAPPNWNGEAPPVVMDGYGATSWVPRPMLPPSGWPGSWAPPVQQPGAGGQASSWAWAPPAQQRPGIPASPASGSAQEQAPQVTDKMSLEEFFLEAGVVDQGTLDKIILDELAEDMLEDGQAERDDRFLSLGDLLLALGLLDAGGSSSGPRTRQVRMPAPAQEALGAADQAAAGSSSGPSSSRQQARMPAQEALRGQAAAVEARERRSRRMVMRRAKGGRN